MKFAVTREHIKSGEQNNPTRCPVALAVEDDTQAIGQVEAELDYIKIGGKKYSTPERVRRFMDRFDYAPAPWRCRPFSFDLPHDGDGGGVEP